MMDLLESLGLVVRKDPVTVVGSAIMESVTPETIQANTPHTCKLVFFVWGEGLPHQSFSLLLLVGVVHLSPSKLKG